LSAITRERSIATEQQRTTIKFNNHRLRASNDGGLLLCGASSESGSGTFPICTSSIIFLTGSCLFL